MLAYLVSLHHISSERVGRYRRSSAQVHSRKSIIKPSDQLYYKHDYFALLGAEPLDVVILHLGCHAVLLEKDLLNMMMECRMNSMEQR